MKDRDDLSKEELQKLKESSLFDEESLDEILKKAEEFMDKELAENKKTIEKNTKEILATISYEEFLKIYRLA